MTPAWLAFPASLLVIVGGWLSWQRANPPRAEEWVTLTRDATLTGDVSSNECLINGAMVQPCPHVDHHLAMRAPVFGCAETDGVAGLNTMLGVSGCFQAVPAFQAVPDNVIWFNGDGVPRVNDRPVDVPEWQPLFQNDPRCPGCIPMQLLGNDRVWMGP